MSGKAAASIPIFRVRGTAGWGAANGTGQGRITAFTERNLGACRRALHVPWVQQGPDR